MYLEKRGGILLRFRSCRRAFQAVESYFLETGSYNRYTTCFIYLFFSPKLSLNRFLCLHGHYPSLFLIQAEAASSTLRNWHFCSSLGSIWHSLVLFVTILFSVYMNEEWVSIYLNVKTQKQMSRPFHITGCFEFWTQLLQATMLERTTWSHHYFLVKVHSRHDEPRFEENSFNLMP